ncbi:TetR/AcrR family transcriptional regulator [Litchfieldia alkalitelluris]|uniref:TetR/AcrR family transcriptional regulator n=1 Tax=Litchfieldia alkalitelluris TaxID=304268 RepID=UPI0009965471|nr:TetR/AcrR family transcriptional regulator [Litchfieldia alkalitelluris]
MAKSWRNHADAYRVQTRENILVATKELILKKGITEVTILDISKKSGISRVTFYKHFNSIHEIAMEIQIQILSEISAIELPKTMKYKNGADKLRCLLLGFAEYFKEHREDLRFIAIFDLAYVNEYPSEELKQKYAEEISSFKTPIVDVLNSGIQDGSLQVDQDPKLVGRTIAHSLLGLVQRLATRTNLVEAPSTDEDILEDFISMIVKSISK